MHAMAICREVLRRRGGGWSLRWGVVVPAGAAGTLLLVFAGITDRLIPLFAVGAFAAFTLSQAGMVMHRRKALRDAGESKTAARHA